VAACGETQVRNRDTNMATKMQVWEYFQSHNLAKAFQSAQRMVLCLPGCFSIFRTHYLIHNDIMEKFAVEPRIDSVFEQNLLQLGEDRYLTLLLVQHSARNKDDLKKVVFLPQATCSTKVPDSIIRLRNQRRRWNNSTLICMLQSFKMIWWDANIFLKYSMVLEIIGVFLIPAVTIHFLVLLIRVFSGEYHIADIFEAVTMLLMFLIQYWVMKMYNRERDFVYSLYYFFLFIPFSALLPFYTLTQLNDFNWGTR